MVNSTSTLSQNQDSETHNQKSGQLSHLANNTKSTKISNSNLSVNFEHTLHQPSALNVNATPFIPGYYDNQNQLQMDTAIVHPQQTKHARNNDTTAIQMSKTLDKLTAQHKSGEQTSALSQKAVIPSDEVIMPHTSDFSARHPNTRPSGLTFQWPVPNYLAPCEPLRPDGRGASKDAARHCLPLMRGGSKDAARPSLLLAQWARGIRRPLPSTAPRGRRPSSRSNRASGPHRPRRHIGPTPTADPRRGGPLSGSH